ncbi:MAG TPA: pilin [Patescibacteria group bacterium]|nr:pilin [Patescibacteria group bacterium]
MKQFLRLTIIFLLSIISLTIPVQSIQAATVNPPTIAKEVTYGGQPDVSFSIPLGTTQASELHFNLAVTKSTNQSGGSGAKTISILVNTEGNTFVCNSPDLNGTTGSKAPFMNFSFTVSGNQCLVKGNLDTTQIGMSSSETAPQTFYLILQGNLVDTTTNQPISVASQFQVDPKNTGNCTKFSIGSVKDHSTQQTLSSVTTGEQVDIFISNFQNGHYSFYFDKNSPVNAYCTTSAGCDVSTSLTVPSNASNPLALTVSGTLDSDGQTYGCVDNLTVSNTSNTVNQGSANVDITPPACSTVSQIADKCSPNNELVPAAICSGGTEPTYQCDNDKLCTADDGSAMCDTGNLLPLRPPCTQGWQFPFKLVITKNDTTATQPPVNTKNPAKIDLCTQYESSLGLIPIDVTSFVQKLFAILLSLTGGIILILLIYSGYQLLLSQGNPDKVKEARERITSAIIGLLFLILSFVILQVLGVDLLHIPGIS